MEATQRFEPRSRRDGCLIIYAKLGGKFCSKCAILRDAAVIPGLAQPASCFEQLAKLNALSSTFFQLFI